MKISLVPQGEYALKKRLISGLLVVMMLLTSAFAVNDADSATGSVDFLLDPVLAADYDAAALDTDLAAAQKTVSARLALDGVTDAAVTTEDGKLSVSIPQDTAGTRTAEEWAARLIRDFSCRLTDDEGHEWALDRADIADTKAVETAPEYAVVTFSDSGKAKLDEAVADVLENADDDLTFHWGTQAFTVPVKKDMDTASVQLGGSIDPLRAGGATYLAGMLLTDPLPFTMQYAAAVPQPAEPTTPTEPAAPTQPTTPSASKFPDIPGHWAANSLTRAVELGLLKGVNGKMLPDNSVKRSEAIVILNRTLGASQTDDISGLMGTPATAWYANDLAKAIHLGLIDGTDARNFDTAASRAEAFVLIARAFVYDRAEAAADELSAFNDTGSMTAEQRHAAAALIAAGIVKGSSAGKLSPDRTLTRAEFVTMLLRIAPNFPGAEDDLSALTGGALLTAPSVSLDSDTLSGDRVFAATSTDVTLSGVTTGSSRVILKGAENAALRVQNDSTLSTIALDPAGAATASLTGGSSAETLVIAGRGGDVTVSGPCENIEITASNRTIRLSNTAADTLTVTGSGNTIVVDGTVGAVSVNAGAKNNTLTLNGSVDTLVAAGIGAKIGGSGKAKSIDVRAANCTVTLKADSQIENVDTGLAGVTIRLGVPTRVTAGGSLLTQASFDGVDEEKICTAQWYQDGKALDGFKNTHFALRSGAISNHTSTFTFTKNMKTSVTVGFKLTYENPSTGETEEAYNEVTVPIENYSDDWYYQRDVSRVLAKVSSEYRGNYTTSYAVNNDYSTAEKEVWVNAKGYSSKTQYLIWVNRAYQHANVFQGSKGNWKLVKSFLVGTGAAGTPTPTGLTTVSYRDASGWTTSTYTVRPVVGFYPGTGYAFHSRLCSPGTDNEYDFSAGYPISHGCVRMYKSDIHWIYNNIPVGTTVAIF